MDEFTKKVEAVLFTTGKFLSLEEIGNMSGLGSQGHLKELLEQLQKHYQEKEGALELLKEGDKWKLAIKKEYLSVTEKLLTDAELDKPTQETLAIIAYKQPMFQSDVIKIRGNSAYDHIKVLKEHDFVTSEKSGRTRVLKLAPKFFEYFDVVAGNLQGILHKHETTPEPQS